MKTFEIVIILNDGTEVRGILCPSIAENIVEAMKVSMEDIKKAKRLDDIESIIIKKLTLNENI